MINLFEKPEIYYIALYNQGIFVDRGRLISATNKALLFDDSFIKSQHIMQSKFVNSNLYDSACLDMEYKILTITYQIVVTYKIFETWHEANDYIKMKGVQND